MSMAGAKPGDGVEAKLLAFMRARGPQFADVTSGTDLIEAGLLDSLLLMDLILYVEELCHIRFEAELVSPATFRSVERLMAGIQAKLARS